MFDFPELEQRELGVYHHYQLSPDMRNWIQHELYKRLEELQRDSEQKAEETEGAVQQEIEIYITSRTYRKQPIFVFGYRNEGGTAIIEAWYFRMMRNPENPYSLQFALDRVPLEQAFGPSNAPPPDQEEEFLY